MNHYGFNLLNMFGKTDTPKPLNDAELDFAAEHGFNFIRLPLDYRNWIHDFEYTKPDERTFAVIDGYIEQILSRGMQACINFHRAPGYCVNRPEIEKHNLWIDAEAQDGFVFNWEFFARRYHHIPSDKLIFNLINEPWFEGDKWQFTRARHAAIMRRAIAAIRAVTPDREIICDGVGGGQFAMPEMADAGVIHGARGYVPFEISHYQASWMSHMTHDREPTWPMELNGKLWTRDVLVSLYQPWLDVEKTGVKVYVGEFGCYDKTPNDVALRWLGDLLSVFKQFGWGYALWQLSGSFGVINHGRPGTKYTKMNGLDVDAELLRLLKENRV
jgi:aryl-phospho-beta-D-glucosidase BglC (GH1 family)